MRELIRYAVIVMLIVFAISMFRTYRVRAAAEEATRFEPVPAAAVVLPAGTAIHASIRSGIAPSSRTGDPVTAFVSEPVVINGNVAIPSVARLKGKLKNIRVAFPKVTVSIQFEVLLVGTRASPIPVQPVVATAEVQSDIDLLSTVARALVASSIGAAAGAASGDLRVIETAVVQVAVLSASEHPATPITVFLSHDFIAP